MSNLVREIFIYPLRAIAFFMRGRSNHPHLLLLPVVVPNSYPVFCILSPSSPVNSVGSGPAPYSCNISFHHAITLSTLVGPTPRLAQAEPAIVEEEVTNFWVPCMISR